jgi:hypothetical protein
MHTETVTHWAGSHGASVGGPADLPFDSASRNASSAASRSRRLISSSIRSICENASARRRARGRRGRGAARPRAHLALQLVRVHPLHFPFQLDLHLGPRLEDAYEVGGARVSDIQRGGESTANARRTSQLRVLPRAPDADVLLDAVGLALREAHAHKVIPGAYVGRSDAPACTAPWPGNHSPRVAEVATDHRQCREVLPTQTGGRRTIALGSGPGGRVGAGLRTLPSEAVLKLSAVRCGTVRARGAAGAPSANGRRTCLRFFVSDWMESARWFCWNIFSTFPPCSHGPGLRSDRGSCAAPEVRIATAVAGPGPPHDARHASAPFARDSARSAGEPSPPAAPFR